MSTSSDAAQTSAAASPVIPPDQAAARSAAEENQSPRKKRGVPEGLWLRCDACSATIFRKHLDKNYRICPECDYHFYVSASGRIGQLLDEGSFEEWYADMSPLDPLGFADKRSYRDRVVEEQKKTGLKDACVVGRGYLRGRPLVLGLTDTAFIMGSMGSVVGEKLTRATEEATKARLPLVIVSGSGGGARMHEGIFSLMQMAKVSAALGRYHEAGGLFISILTNPTMGGVAASFASLGDIIIAEPKALIGFAGPRVIMATTRQKLPEGLQSSEFLLKHGFVDRIVSRPDLRSELARIIDYCQIRRPAST
ncbi:acetyl-CoA carboxylase, carboxyltransferase subunit beta [Planctomicrobium piriforme]|uniref:Acetyl-coenzyme A carboxylase carboxyl transferase subunit beta n=1 Tax=Planctomicrobium piriforme TaxID=1576369 RepID=A0A1I3MTH1_9PLAN|nr:acetyl-CoA carboxylase, carboxyltransferase subunit beta [Planctomicrobium piriforme]SFJ00231.1 acetyl-CoA carboxylase carboxyl transferase subunit beta [Planctomicrobium piriforme]